MFKWLRIMVFLRRIARTLETLVDLEEQRIALEHPEWGREHKVSPTRKASGISISSASPDKINQRWRQNHPFVEEED